MIKLSVIIPTYNRKRDLEECLDSLLAQNISLSNFEVIVIDDGSDDRTDGLFVRGDRWERLQLVYRRQEKRGTPYAMNKGVEIARGNIVAFIDSDCIVAKDWIRNIIYYHERFQDIMAIQGRILNALDNHFIPTAEQEILDRYLNYLILDNGAQKFINIIAPGNCSIKMEVFKERSSFFSLFPGDEADLTNQLLERNEKILYVDKIVVKHKHRTNIFSYMKKYFMQGMGEYLAERKWQKNLRDYNTKEFRPVNFALSLFRNFLIKYKLKGIVFFIIYVLRKFARTLGYMYEKLR